MVRTIKHIALQSNWESIYEKVKNPRTVVMGSFNPYHPLLNVSPEFYYCRIPRRGRGNQFWRSIARNLILDEHYFLQNEAERLRVMNEYGFVLFDLIDELHLTSEDSNHLDTFIQEKIFTNFSDSMVWAGDTNGVSIKRIYNDRLVQFIANTPGIDLIVNTLGVNRGNLDFNVTEYEWQRYKTSLFNAAQTNHVHMNLTSISPSPQRIDVDAFDKWVKVNILR